MKWEEVRTIYPDKFVKLQVLASHMEGNKKYIDDMAVIKVISDNKEATKELVHSVDNILVYHTGNEVISVEVKNIRGYRGVI
ncbi:MAG TPA: hypothetical protein VIK72_12035 [Clostridiaceae bacterium]